MDYLKISEKIVNNITHRDTLYRLDVAQLIDECPETISRKISSGTAVLPPALDQKRTKFPRQAVIEWLAERLESNI